MIEIKLSQGAKPGHGGVLPAAKVSAEIAAGARRAARASIAFRRRGIRRSRRPMGLLRVRRAAARRCRAASRPASSSRSAIRGSGSRSPRRCRRPASCRTSSSSTAAKAAPARRRWSSPTTSARRMREALMLVHNTLVGLDLRDTIRIGAAGRVISAFDIARTHGAGRRLVQRGARLHVRARLHPVAELPHRHAARPASRPRIRSAGSKRWTCRTRPRACTFPREHAEGAARAAGRGRPRPSGPARSRAHPPPRLVDRGAFAGGVVSFPGARRAAGARCRNTPVFRQFWAEARSDSFAPPAKVSAMREAKML